MRHIHEEKNGRQENNESFAGFETSDANRVNFPLNLVDFVLQNYRWRYLFRPRSDATIFVPQCQG